MGIYFDNAATSFPKPECVYRAVEDFMRGNGTSPGRGNYARAMASELLIYETRKAVAKLLGVKRPSQIIFTSNATEALNLALKGFLSTGDRVLCSSYEHNALWRPLKTLERDRGVIVEQISCLADGQINLSEISTKLPRTKLIAITHASNVLGTITPLAEISKMARAHRVPILVDAAQTAGSHPINATELGIDLLAFTGHKGLLGPTGTGGLCLVNEELSLNTFCEGGTGSMATSPYQPEDPPDRFEAGTMNIFGLVGLKAAVNYLLERGVETIRQHEMELTVHLWENLRKVDSITLYGPGNLAKRVSLLSFNLSGQDPYEVARKLDSEYGIMVRAGLHCAPLAHRLLGTEKTGAVRVSIGPHNTIEEIDHLVHALKSLSS